MASCSSSQRIVWLGSDAQSQVSIQQVAKGDQTPPTCSHAPCSITTARPKPPSPPAITCWLAHALAHAGIFCIRTPSAI